MELACNHFITLTPRELQVTEGLLKGMSYKQVGELLGISINTVRKHIRQIYNKLNINSRSELMGKYLYNTHHKI